MITEGGTFRNYLFLAAISGMLMQLGCSNYNCRSISEEDRKMREEYARAYHFKEALGQSIQNGDTAQIHSILTDKHTIYGAVDAYLRSLEMRNNDMARFIIENEGMSNDEALSRAAYFGNQEIFQFALQRGADINASTLSGDYNPLGEATGRASKQFVLNLLKHNPEVKVRDQFGRTPLMRAAGNSQLDAEVMSALIDRGSDVNASDSHGETALMAVFLQFRSADLEKVKILILRGAAINARAQNGDTALFLSLRSGATEIAEYLIRKGADYRSPDFRERYEKLISDRNVWNRLQQDTELIEMLSLSR